jgi:hypothetical protein
LGRGDEATVYRVKQHHKYYALKLYHNLGDARELVEKNILLQQIGAAPKLRYTGVNVSMSDLEEDPEHMAEVLSLCP